MSEPRPRALLLHDHADQLVADRLRVGLGRFSKPLMTRRAIDVAPADPASFSADDDTKLVLLASPAAAASELVGATLRRWIEVRGPDSVLPVVLGDGWTWDAEQDDFKWSEPDAVTSVPPALRGAFTSEPRHLQLAAEAEPGWYSLGNPGFRDQLAEIAAPIRNRPKDELEDADARRQRRRRRVVSIGSLGLVALLVASVLLAVVAVSAQRAAIEERDAADLAAATAQERTRQATALRLATLAATDDSLEQDLRALLAVAAYELAPDGEAISGFARVLSREIDETTFDPETGEPIVAESAVTPPPQPAGLLPGLRVVYDNGVVEQFNQEEQSRPRAGSAFLDAEGRFVYPGEGDAPGSIVLQRIATATEASEEITVDDVSEVMALGLDGDLVVATRPPPTGDDLRLFAYPEASTIWTDETRTDQTVRPADGPWSCRAVFDAVCSEAVVIDRATGGEIVLPPELGRSYLLPIDFEPAWPDPLVQHRFTADGRYLVSFDPVGDLVFVTSIVDGTTRPVVAGGNERVSDFGLVDDTTAWRLLPSTLEVFDLATGAPDATYDVAWLGRTVAADIDPTGRRALIGVAPSDFVLLDLATLDIVARRATGERAEAVTLGPSGRWAAIGGGGGNHLVRLPDLTIMATERSRYFANDFAPDEAVMVFDPTGTRLSIWGVNQPTDGLTTVRLDFEGWYEAVCAVAGRDLTAAEWDRYVRLPDQEPLCDEISPAGPSLDVSDEAAGAAIESNGATGGATGSGSTSTGGTDADDAPMSSETSDPSSPETTGVAGGPVALGANGLGVVAFGATEAEALEALTPLLGQPDRFECRFTGPESECGPHDPQGIFLSWGPLSLYLPDRFESFTYYPFDDDDPLSAVGPETPTGITIGSTVGDVLAAHTGVETLVGCDEDVYEPIYGPANSSTTDGELLDFRERYQFSLRDGTVVGIRSASDAYFGFWTALGCGP
jgi:hypothetical protein